jgi:hypothetical protein
MLNGVCDRYAGAAVTVVGAVSLKPRRFFLGIEHRSGRYAGAGPSLNVRFYFPFQLL